MQFLVFYVKDDLTLEWNLVTLSNLSSFIKAWYMPWIIKCDYDTHKISKRLRVIEVYDYNFRQIEVVKPTEAVVRLK
jgi:hypothetical protein